MSPRRSWQYRLISAALLAILVLVVLAVFTLGEPLGRGVGPHDFRILRSAGGITLAATAEDDRLTELAGWIDRWNRLLARHFAVQPPPATIRLLGHRREFRDYGRRYLSGFGDTMDFCYCRSDRTIYGYLGVAELIQARLRHELVHRLIHQNLPLTPLWLDEGLAELAEGFTADAEGNLAVDAVQAERLRRAALLLDDPVVNPARLAGVGASDLTGDRNEDWYSLAYAVVLLLERQGRLDQALAAGAVAIDQDDYAAFLRSPDRWTATLPPAGGKGPCWQLALIMPADSGRP